MTLLLLLWGLTLVAAQTRTTIFWPNAADTCAGSASPECAENVPGCDNDGCKDQRSWDISNPFGGEYDPGPAALRTTETGGRVKDEGGNTDWIILR